LLSFERVGRRHRDGPRETAVLDGISFELEQGVGMGVYGQRRSGKSTLLRLAAGLEAPDRGRVFVQGRDLAPLSRDERARLLRGPVALLGGEPWAPAPGETVLDHVALSAGSAGMSLREARRAALAVLDRAGVAGVSAEETPPALSPAERARVALARAIVREPRLLLVDEPAPLPSVLERERFCALLRAIAQERGMALLVASEELSALQGLAVLASLSGGELCSTREDAAVIEFPRRRAAGEAT
jgi:putative ABC transport system ATP-binding protein